MPDGATFPRSRLDELTEQAKKAGAAGLAWFRVVENGPAARRAAGAPPLRAGGGARPARRRGRQPGDLVLAVSDEYATACLVLGTLRTAIGAPPVSQGPHRYVWVVDFPMFEGFGADGTSAGRRTTRSPCPMPRTCRCWRPTRWRCARRPTTWCSTGGSWGRGASVSTAAEIQEQVFAALGIGPEEAEARFGFLLGAFRYGAPPHAGFAFGVDRLAAILAGEENIREVIAYPKTQSGADPLTGAPTPLPAATPGRARDPGRGAAHGAPAPPSEPANPSPS